MTLQIVLPAGPGHRPGSLLRAEIRWHLPSAPLGGAVELGWATTGKGSGDTQVVAQLELAELPPVDHTAPAELQASDARSLELRLPAGPYSFSGTLISLTWTLRARLAPYNERATAEIVLSTDGRAAPLKPACGRHISGETSPPGMLYRRRHGLDHRRARRTRRNDRPLQRQGRRLDLGR